MPILIAFGHLFPHKNWEVLFIRINTVSYFTGLRKAKKYDWKDSNMALFGSDTEKQVKSKCYVPKNTRLYRPILNLKR